MEVRSSPTLSRSGGRSECEMIFYRANGEREIENDDHSSEHHFYEHRF